MKYALVNLLLSVSVAFSVITCQAEQPAPQKKENVKPAASAPAAVAKADSTKPATVAESKLIVYYFHTNFRCHSCTMIENLTKQAVNSGFAEQLKKGSIELKIINIEEPGNEHFAEDYKLYTKSVILSDVKSGKEASWKNLEKVWTLLGDEQKFIDYIQAEVKTLL